VLQRQCRLAIAGSPGAGDDDKRTAGNNAGDDSGQDCLAGPGRGQHHCAIA
jgi:hypothetical protein